MKESAFITARQLTEAQDRIEKMTQEVKHKLTTFHHLDLRHQNLIRQQITYLNKHLQNAMKQLLYAAQITRFLSQAKFQFQKVQTIAYFNDIIGLIHTEIDQAPLTKEQKLAAKDEIESSRKYNESDLLQTSSTVELNSTFAGDINALHGVLSKYIRDSQVYVSVRLKHLLTRTIKYFDQQNNLSVTAKQLANQQLFNIQTDVETRVLFINSFVKLKKYWGKTINQIHQVVHDHDHVYQGITDFEQAMQKIRVIIARKSQLPVNIKFYLESQVTKDRQMILAQVSDLEPAKQTAVLKQKHQQVLHDLFPVISQRYQHEILMGMQYLTQSQQLSLTNQIQQVTKHAQQLDRPYTEQMLVKHLARLNKIMQKETILLRQNHLSKIIDETKLDVMNFQNLSAEQKRQLQTQVVDFGKYLSTQKTTKSLMQIKADLHALFEKQRRIMVQKTFLKQLWQFQREIRLSHLSDEQQHHLRMRLLSIKRNSDDDSVKQIELKQVTNDGLGLDRNVNFQLLAKLKSWGLSYVNNSGLGSYYKDLINQQITAADRTIDNADRLAVVDHAEQVAENEIYRNLYDSNNQINVFKIQALQIPFQQLKKLNNDLSISILQPLLKQYLSDRISHRVNIYVKYMASATTDTVQLKHLVIQFKKYFHSQTLKTVAMVKKEYIRQLTNVMYDHPYQILTYLYHGNFHYELGSVKYKAVQKVQNTNELLQIEYAHQKGIGMFNDLINQTLGSVDHPRIKAHQQVQKLVAAAKKHLSQNQLISKDMKQSFLNHILQIANRYNQSINEGLDEQWSQEYHSCRNDLNRVLQKGYLYEWSILTRDAQTMIRGLNQVPIDTRIERVKLLHNLNMETIDMINQSNQAKLPKLFQQKKSQVQAIVKKSVYLDPVKKHALDHLKAVNQKFKDQISKMATDKEAKKADKVLPKLDKIVNQADDQLIISKGDQVKKVVDRSKTQLNALGLKIIRKLQTNHFNRNVNQYGKKLRQFKLLSNADLKKLDQQFNNNYHKFIHKLRKATTTSACLKDGQQGIDVILKIYKQGQGINDHKYTYYQKVQSQAEEADQIVSQLEYLQKADKKAGQRLLKQIQQQSIGKLKNTDGDRELEEAYRKSSQMIEHVINEVSTANVLVSAINSANKKVSNSHLDKAQKQATLKQIHQIINVGIKSQLSMSDDDKGSQNDSKKSK